MKKNSIELKLILLLMAVFVSLGVISSYDGDGVKQQLEQTK